MSRFKVTTESSDAGKPVSRGEFVGDAAMVQSRVGNRPLKPVHVNFSLGPDKHRRLEMQAAEADISIANFVHGLIREGIG